MTGSDSIRGTGSEEPFLQPCCRANRRATSGAADTIHLHPVRHIVAFQRSDSNRSYVGDWGAVRGLFVFAQHGAAAATCAAVASMGLLVGFGVLLADL